MSQKEVNAIKPLSRFIEHFDTMPPTELLNMIGEEEQLQEQTNTSASPTPLYVLPHGFNKHDSSGPEQQLNDRPTSPTSPTRKSYLVHCDSNPSSPLDNSPMPPIVSQTSSSSFHASHNSHSEIITSSTNELLTESNRSPEFNSNNAPSIITAIAMNNNLSNITHQQHKQNPQVKIFSPTTGGTRKKLGSKPSLNRAEFIIRRYESWNTFINLLVSWINEIAKQSAQAEKIYQASIKESKFFGRKAGNDHHSTNNSVHGFTADLALKEQKFGRQLQTEQIPILEKFRKESTLIIKNLKSRTELSQEEFWKRAEVTANYISQLNKVCKEATLCIEKGAPIDDDPWLINLYVLRALRGEVNEENRLRNLMVPIQQSMRVFEERLLKTVENTLKVCFDKPVALSDAQLGKIQSSLNQAITNNWTTFAAMNKKDIVDEENPLKHYLKIKYACKSNPLVMTVYKGELERRTGVLNSKYTRRFFVVTKSGFLHQFKLTDQVSPESSIYLAKCTVSPCMDIFTQNDKEEKLPKEGFTFEVQRPGSGLHRDKSYMFRASNFKDMVTWCRHISEVAAQSPEAILRPVFVSPTHSSNAVLSSNDRIPLSIDPYHPLQQDYERRPVSPVQLSNAIVSNDSIQLVADTYTPVQQGPERRPVSPIQLSNTVASNDSTQPVISPHIPAQQESERQLMSPIQISNTAISSDNIQLAIDSHNPTKSEPVLSPQLAENKQYTGSVHQTQLQESTPPPSPIEKDGQYESIQSVIMEDRRVSEGSLNSFYSFEHDATTERIKLYTPQLNI